MQSIKSKLRTDSVRYLSIVLVLCGSLAMIVSGCTNSSDLASPTIVTVPADFSVTPGSFQSKYDPIAFSSPFTNTIDTISATLSSAVSWNVDLLGLTSGAAKRISGLSSQVIAPWNGGHDGIQFFKDNEQVRVTLSFYGTDLALTDTVTISKVKRYNDVVDNIVGGVPVKNHMGLLLTDFEAPGVLPISPSGWYNFHDPSGSSGIPGPAEEQDSNTVSSSTFINAVQGNQYYYFEGTDRAALNSNYSTFFIMGAGFDVGSHFLNQITDADIHPENLYFNVYVYGFGLPNTKFQVGFDEDDNGDNAWDPYLEDELVYITRVDWVGWKLLSFKYTDAKFSNIDPKGGAHGNKKHEPFKVTKMGFVMNTDPATMHAKVAYDFPCFTYGRPFNPNN
jgi:hypothetical protein